MQQIHGHMGIYYVRRVPSGFSAKGSFNSSEQLTFLVGKVRDSSLYPTRGGYMFI